MPQILQTVANRNLLPKLMSFPCRTEYYRMSIIVSFLLLHLSTSLINLTNKQDSVELFIRKLILQLYHLRDGWFKLLNVQESPLWDAASEDAHKLCTCVWENVKKGQLLQYCRSHAEFRALDKTMPLPTFYKRKLTLTFVHFTSDLYIMKLLI